KPDMRHPILYALSGLRHWECPLPALDFTKNLEMTFQPPDTTRFPCLRLAREALRAGGTMTAVLNTANERAVDAFCSGRVRFTDIPVVIESVMNRHCVRQLDSLETIREADRWTRRILAEEWGV
ncbi:MAG TPA: 1-deoxy-D-xylulose-5-phosphate reductoisomerase, partial [bacterium]|nr:1-deoxy-D-xylulose-5-phosphate reductoisomerase [bacterium]